MILDFETMNVTEIPHFYGGEKSILAKLSNDGLNKIMVGRVVPGASIGVHTHETSSEIVYVISGSGKADIRFLLFKTLNHLVVHLFILVDMMPVPHERRVELLLRYIMAHKNRLSEGLL